MEPSRDLAGAFMATFRHAPPLTRTIKQPISDNDHPGQIWEVLTQTAKLAPVRLVKLKGTRYALLISETLQNVGHAWPGAFSIAYLDHGKRWTLRHLWPELTFMGARGIAADKIWQANFWSEPLILASSTFCTMGGCTADIAVFALGDTAPRFLGTVPGDAEYQPDNPPLDDCEAYHYSAKVGPAGSKNDVFSVRFSGWTAAPGSNQSKRPFDRKTDYAISPDGLTPRPEIDIPDCGS